MDMLRKCPYRQIFITGDRHEGFRYNYQCGGRHIRRRPWHAFEGRAEGTFFNRYSCRPLGYAPFLIGISGALKGMLRVENGTLETTGTMLLIASLVTGSLLGEWIQIEKWMDRFGEWLREKVGGKNDSQFCGRLCFSFPCHLRRSHGHCGRFGGWYAGRLLHACRQGGFGCGNRDGFSPLPMERARYFPHFRWDCGRAASQFLPGFWNLSSHRKLFPIFPLPGMC